jgi:hypothetical protein
MTARPLAADLIDKYLLSTERSTIKQYLLSIYEPDGDAPPADVLAEIMRDARAVDEELRSAGAWV